MQLSKSEEDILREYQATKDRHRIHSNHGKGQIILESRYLPQAKQLYAESLSTLSQGNSPISQVRNILKPPSSDRRQLRYGGCQQEESSQIKCVFELYHDDEVKDGNNNQVEPDKVSLPDPNEMCFDLPMSNNLDTRIGIIDNNTRKLSNASAIRVSPNNTFSSHINNKNNQQIEIQQRIQDDYPSQFLYNTILSGISNGTGTITQNIFQPVPEQKQYKAIQKEEHYLNNQYNQPSNYADILNASAYSMYLQENNNNNNNNNKSTDKPNHTHQRSSEFSQIGNNSMNQISHQRMNSRDSRFLINTHQNSNYSAAEALTQASLQQKNGLPNDLNQSQQDRVKLQYNEALDKKSKLLCVKSLQNTIISNNESQINSRRRNKTYDQEQFQKDFPQIDQLQQQVNYIAETNNQRADLSNLIDGFNLQSRLKINGIKSYERYHRHARFFKREIPLSLEDEQSFYIETSTKKHRQEYTKQVISPSADIIAKNRLFSNKENYDSNNVYQQRQFQLPNKEVITFESKQSYNDKEEEIEENLDKKTFSPSSKQSGRKGEKEQEEDLQKQSFSFQKNESVIFKKQSQNNQSQQHMNENNKNSSRSNRNKFLHNSSSQHCNKDSQRKHKSQQSSQQEAHQHQQFLESSKLIKDKSPTRNDQINSQDAATQVSIQQSRDIHSRNWSSRNTHDYLSYKSSRYSPEMEIQGEVHDLSYPSVISEQGNSQQNQSDIVDWSSSRKKENNSCNDRQGQLSQAQQLKQQMLKQVTSNRSYSSIKNRLLNKNGDNEDINNLNIEQQKQLNNLNGKRNCFKQTLPVKNNCFQFKEQKDKDDSQKQVIFSNQVIQEQTSKLQTKKEQKEEQSPDMEKHQKQLRNNSCYSIGTSQQKGHLQQKTNGCRKDRRTVDMLSDSQQQSDVNTLKNMQQTKIKSFIDNNSIEIKNISENSTKKSGNIKKIKHKINHQDNKDHTDYKHPKESKESVLITDISPSVNSNNTKYQKRNPNYSNATRIRSKSLIDKIQCQILSKNQVGYLIQHHASCCRNFRKELQTSFYNN